PPRWTAVPERRTLVPSSILREHSMSGPLVRRAALVLAPMVVLGASACTSDQITAPPAPLERPSAPASTLVNGPIAIQRYAAIGPSISAGVQSDGLLFATQATSWPAQLAAAAGIGFNQPLIAAPGCRSPIVSPAGRLSGEGIFENASLLSCAPLLPGVT